MNKKIITFLSLVLALSMFLVGCGSNGGSSTNGGNEDVPNLYFIAIRAGGAAWSQAQLGFEAAIDELGWKGTFVAPTTANDVSQMANLLETAITNKADGVLGVFHTKDVFADIITRAREEGVIIGSTNVNLGGIENFYIGTDHANMGKAQAEALIELVDGGQANVVYLVTSLGSENMQIQYNAFVEALEGHGNIKIHGMETDDNNPITAADKLNNLLKLDPTINAVICTNSSGASLGVANFVEENGLQDEFYTVGIDASADILNYVKSGALSVTLDQDFYTMGYEGVMMIKTLLEGGTVEYANDSGVIKVTADTADEYAAKKGIKLD